MYEAMMRTLLDVRHVSNLKKNLISLGTLDTRKKRCRCSFEGGGIKVAKGSLVIMKGSMVGRFYVLQGSMITV